LRSLVVFFFALLLLSAPACAAEPQQALPQAAPRSENIEAVGKLVFAPGIGYSLADIEYATITVTPGAVERDDAAVAKKLTLRLRVAESKGLVRQLEDLTGKRVLVKGPSFASLDSVTHDIDANGTGFSIAAAVDASAVCATADDCKDFCKGVGWGKECLPDGKPSCQDRQCRCTPTCL
jgi:hypothetical protein